MSTIQNPLYAKRDLTLFGGGGRRARDDGSPGFGRRSEAQAVISGDMSEDEDDTPVGFAPPDHLHADNWQPGEEIESQSLL